MNKGLVIKDKGLGPNNELQYYGEILTLMAPAYFRSQ